MGRNARATVGAMTLPYSKKKDESPEAFEAFAAYRDSGTGRSIRAVGESLGKSEALMSRWSSRHKWVKRAHAFDAERDRRQRLVDLGEADKMRRRHIRIALDLQDLGISELGKMLAEAKRLKKKRGSLDDAFILKALEAGTKLERLNRGEPGEIVETHGGETVDLSGLSLNELKALRTMRSKVRAAQQRAAEGGDEE